MRIPYLLVVVGVSALSAPARSAVSQRPVADSLHWSFVTVDGKPVKGIVVRTTSTDGSWTTYTADSMGHVVLTFPATGRAIAEAAGFRSAHIQQYSSEHKTPPSEAKFAMRAPLTGTVTDEQGHPVGGAAVDVDSMMARDTLFIARRTPIAQTVTNGQGKFVVAPRAFYDVSGLMDSDDPLMLYVSAGAPTAGMRRAALVPLSFDAQRQTTPTFPITIRPLRPVQFRVAVGHHLPADHLWMEVLPPDSAVMAHRDEWVPRFIMDVALHPIDPQHWGATVALPSNTRYQEHFLLHDGRLLPLDSFTVAPASNILALPDITLTETQQFMARLPQSIAPELQVTTVNGTAVHLADYRGKVVVLDFWGLWCRPCLEKMPMLSRIADTYRDSNVVVLLIHDASLASVDEYRSQYAKKLTPTLGQTAPAFVQLLDMPPATDSTGKAGERGAGTGRTIDAYDIGSFPTTMVIDPQGRLVGIAQNEMEAHVDASGQIIPGSLHLKGDTVLEGLIQQARHGAEKSPNASGTPNRIQ